MEKKDEINVKHPLYDTTAAVRQTYLDAIEGTRKMREKRETYLPKFEAERDKSYDWRCKTATFFNLVKKTRDVMTGLVFEESIELGADVPKLIKDYWENIDNATTHGDVFARKVFEESFAGYAAILTDAPEMQVDSLEAEKKLGLRPYWLMYPADCIWNGDERINPNSKKRELEFIVLREKTREKVGSFLFQDVIRYRHFYLRDEADGTHFYWEVKREEEKDGKTILIDEGNGELMNATALPVSIVGKLWSPPRFMDIVDKNIELLQTYSDFKMDIHKVCRPVPVAKDREVKEGGAMVIGADVLIDVSASGEFYFAEPAGSSLEIVRQVLRDMRDDISLMGLSILADKTAKVDVTATEALLNNIGETAEIRVMARELQDALELSLGHLAEYMKLPKVSGGSLTLGAAWNKEPEVKAVPITGAPKAEQPKEMVM